MEPSEWNIVVLAAWNRAILTPAWISQTMFGLAANVPVEVLVPLDGLAPYQVHNEGLTVIPLPRQLMIQLDKPTPDLLGRAMMAARRALDDLRRTPLRACGINLRYSSAEPSEALLANTRCATERLFPDNNYTLRVRRRGEILEFNEGVLNVIADIPMTGPVSLTLNFDRQSSNREDLVGWLERPADEYVAEATKVVDLIAR